MMGGRAAEELIFDHLSTGASNDLEQATMWARRMVCEYGMSDTLGPVSYGEQGGDVFLGRDMVTRRDFSEQTSAQIDSEVSAVLISLYGEAKQLLADNREILERIVEALLERETLESADLAALHRGEPLPPLPVPLDESTAASPKSKKEREGGLGGMPDPEPIAG